MGGVTSFTKEGATVGTEGFGGIALMAISRGSGAGISFAPVVD